MKNLRYYGKSPYTLALVHGGPGAKGSLAGAARELGRFRGVLEPIQTQTDIPSLVQELHEQLSLGHPPLTLAGHSWGAWLALIYAAYFGDRVRHLVLISCPPLTEEFTPLILKNRLARLSSQEAQDYIQAEQTLATRPDTAAFETLQRLTQQTDFVKPCPYDDSALDPDPAQYQAVWPQAAQLRQQIDELQEQCAQAAQLRASGKLFQFLKRISCQVSVVHGSQDPHPLSGVLAPLAQAEITPQVLELAQCGHSPFAEQFARDEFYRFLLQA